MSYLKKKTALRIILSLFLIIIKPNFLETSILMESSNKNTYDFLFGDEQKSNKIFNTFISKNSETIFFFSITLLSLMSGLYYFNLSTGFFQVATTSQPIDKLFSLLQFQLSDHEYKQLKILLDELGRYKHYKSFVLSFLLKNFLNENSETNIQPLGLKIIQEIYDTIQK